MAGSPNGSRNDGKGAERLVQDGLTLFERKHRATFVRLYDSTSAGATTGGNFLPSQPADFIVTYNGKTSLLEVKSSVVHNSLAETVLRNVFSEDQIKGARLWVRAGNLATAAFYSHKGKAFEWWDMQHIVKAYLSPPRQRKLTADSVITTGNSEAEVVRALLRVLK